MSDSKLYTLYLYPESDAHRMEALYNRVLDHFENSDDELQVRGSTELFGVTGLQGRGPVEGHLYHGDHDGPKTGIESSYTLPPVPHLMLVVDQKEKFKYTLDDNEREGPKFFDRLEGLITLITEIYRVLPDTPQVAYALPANYVYMIFNNDLRSPATGDSLAQHRIEYVPWLVILPPAMVDTYGRETLLEAPAWRVEELSDGSIMVITFQPQAYDWLRDRDPAPVNEHLGLPRFWKDVAGRGE